MKSKPTETLVLLQRWHGGERAALESLIERDFDWVRRHVERRLGPLLERRGDADDYVQDAMLEALRYTPRFLMSDKGQFRALLARITENVLRDHAERLRTQKRDPARERPYVGDTMLSLDPPKQSVARPSQLASKGEEQVWLEIGLEMLDADERRIVRLREFDGLSFVEIGSELGLGEDAVRKRFHRALPKLARIVRDLQAGNVTDAVGGPAASD
ncbi:MAG: sigma-70 family RNA polymerase sigma factor [Planctomycetes bacterium]|nr:sigma-70 family RNA polymerase sigma factor [Planctomycetota bacterium]